MIAELLNDIKEGHYFWMRRHNSESESKIKNFGLLFLSMLAYYSCICLLLFGIYFKTTGNVFDNVTFLSGIPVFFGPYIALYYALVRPKIHQDGINENIPEFEKERKIKIAKKYLLACILSIPITVTIYYFIFNP